MTRVKSPSDGLAIAPERGAKRWKIGGTFRSFCTRKSFGPPQCDTKPSAARQPRGAYQSTPNSVVDRRPPVCQKPLTPAALDLLELYFRLNAFVMAIEENAPVEWAAASLLGVRKARAYAIQREIDAHANLEAWFGQKVLDGMSRGRIGRGRETQPSRLADAFFIALAGGVSEARKCGRSLSGNGQAELPVAGGPDCDAVTSEVRDYLVYSGLLWRLCASE
jgi:hypothetical protein